MQLATLPAGSRMAKKLILSALRRDYQRDAFTEADIEKNPIDQFKRWLDEIIATGCLDPTAMVLSTINQDGFPESRVVLLKDIRRNEFVFFTNYLSNKARDIARNPIVALNFYWPELDRQVRIQGFAKKTSRNESIEYFQSRPITSQLSAIASLQSTIIPSRDILEQKISAIADHASRPLDCPDYWGGYRVRAQKIEFWQGRESRLHDRIVYLRKNKSWIFHRLAP